MIVAFEKTDRVRHLGHLDLLRSMQRALRRSELPIRYSQGFNPHVMLSFASPLAVGMSGEEELMDVALDAPVSEKAFAEKLSVALPQSLPLVKVRAVEDRRPALMAQLQTARYRAMLPGECASFAMAETISSLLDKPEIMAIRKTKSGEKECDIRPMIHELHAECSSDMVCLQMRVSLTERETLKPSLLLQTLASMAQVEPPAILLRRIRLYGERDGQPVPLMEL